jgi:TonB-dependent starch-binding outer membrane protein SusC
MTKFYLYLSRYLAVLLLLVTATAWSQSRTVSGKVTSSDDGSGLPGVNIVEKGTNNGTISDASGSFSLTVGSNATLVFSFVGYKPSEVVVEAQTAVNVVLEADVTALSEVIVIGYGQTTVKDATGAVAAVSAKDFNGGLISSPEQLITGKTAGVQMVSTSGAPGAGVNIRIRGTSSIRSNNNPLFVVDGVPLAGGTQPAAADVGYGTQQDTNPLNFINPNDIESMSILKDASATAIYGSRGANGVVIITTKGGSRATRGVLEFSSSISISSPRKKYDLLNKDEFLAGVAQYGGDPVAQNFGADTDWQDYILRTSVSNTQNLSYSKSYKTGSFRVSGSYDDQNGIVKNSSMTRLSARINANKSFFENKLTFDLNSTFSNVKREDPALSGNSGFQGDLLGAAYSANPTWPTDPDYNAGGQRSPANMLEYYQSTGSTNRFLNNISASYKLTNSLTAKATYGLDYADGNRITLLSPKSINGGNGLAGFGQGQLNENKNLNNLVELTLNYSKKIGIVNIEAVGGYSYQSFHNQWSWATAKGFAPDADFDRMDSQLRDSYDVAYDATHGAYPIVNNFGFTKEPALGIVPGFVSGIENGATVQKDIPMPAGVTTLAMAGNYYDQTDFLQSYFARANFTINDKFLITATVRADGSSKFGPENKYGIFPSGAVAWKMHDEDFMPETVSTFKLRASYGIVGNQDGLGYAEYRARTRYQDAGINDARQVNKPGVTTIGQANPALKWESTTSTGAGIDFGFFNDKLTGAFDVYVKNTTDLLLRGNTAQPAQANSYFLNMDATVENKGWELSLSYNAIEKQDATFTIGGNVSQNKNTLNDLIGVMDAGTIYGQGLSGAYAQRLSAGYSLFSYHLREFEGFDENGQPIGDNQTFVGKSALPTWNVGLSLSATYKAFDFAAYFNGQFGQYIYNNTANAYFIAGSINNARNVTQDVLTNGEAGTAEAAVSTRFLEKGDFFRMQNFTLGYTVPLKEMKAIKKLRFYGTGQNIFVITNYTGLDPEVSSSPATSGLLNGLPTAGIDYGAYPRPRTFTIGLNVSF